MTRQSEAGRLLDVSDYELRHLAAHLEAAGRTVDLHRLLGMETPDAGGGNLWFRAKSAIGDDVGYADDLERAWRLARVATIAGNREATERWSLEARYALMVASLASQAAGMPPGLVARLVETEIWTTEQAISAAQRMPDLERRTEALAAIAERATLDAETRERVLGAALQAARQITDPYRQSRTVAALALKLPASLLPLATRLPSPSPKVLELEYSTGVAAGGNQRQSPAPTSAADAERLLTDAESLETESDRVERLAAAIPYLTPSTITRAREIVSGLSGELQRTFALARLVPRLVELDQIDEAREALTTVASTRSLDEGVTRLMAGTADVRHPITDSFWAAETASRDVRQGALDEAPRLARALDDARRIGDGDACDAVVSLGAALAGQMGASDAAIALTGNVHLPQARCEAIAALASSIASCDDRLVELARQIDDTYWRSVALLGVLPHLDRGERAQAAEAIEQIAVSWGEHGLRADQAADILARVVPHLADREQVRSCQRALDLARSAGDDVHAQVLVIGLSVDPDRWIRIAESETDSLADESVRGFVLARLAATLAAQEHVGSTHAVELASSIVDPYWRNMAMASVVRTLARQGRGSGALKALRSLDPAFVTPSIAAAVAGVLDDGGGRQLIELLAGGGEPGRRARSLASIALTARDTWRHDAIRSAVASAAMAGDETERSVALVLLAQVERSSLTEDLEPIATTLEDTVARAVAEIGVLLAAADPAIAVEIALQRSRELKPDVAAAAVLRLVAAVPAWHHPLAAAMAASIDGVTDPEVRVDLIRAIAAASATVDAVTLARCWTDALVREAPAGRAWLARVLAELLPVAVRLGQVDLLVAVTARVDEVRRWWP